MSHSVFADRFRCDVLASLGFVIPVVIFFVGVIMTLFLPTGDMISEISR